MPSTRFTDAWVGRMVGNSMVKMVHDKLDGVAIGGAVPTERCVLACNHVNRMDGPVIYALGQLLFPASFVLIGEAGLAAHPYLRTVGGRCLKRGEQADASLLEAAQLVRDEGHLWMFPQGEQRPSHLRPIDVRPGVIRLNQAHQLRVVCVGLQYRWRERTEPQAQLWFGQTLEAGTATANAVQRGIEAAIDTLDTGPTLQTMIAPSASGSLGSKILGYFTARAEGEGER